MNELKTLPKIESVSATEIIDSRGTPTVRVHVTLADGSHGSGDAPSGASTGKYEAHERRDGDESRYRGRGVREAVGAVNTIIADTLRGTERRGQRAIDSLLCELDGTASKGRLGANAILPVSIAYTRACAAHYDIPLYAYIGGIFASGERMPCPMMNILNGGAHSKNNIDIQEFMLVPTGASSVAEAVRIGSEVYGALGGELSERGLSTGVGDEGGFAPSLDADEEALELIVGAVDKAGHRDKTSLALDVAASEWAEEKSEGLYKMPKRGGVYTTEELILYYNGLIRKYPIISIEDGLGEDDGDGWASLTASLGERLMLVGDDLFVTNRERIADGIENGRANAVLIKPNQAGSVTETLEAISTARGAGYRVIVSHRSGETEDAFIADLAVGVGAEFIKTGAPCRAERTSKYNRLIEIEAELHREMY